MSRYIDADALLKYPIRLDHYDKVHGNRHFVLGIESVIAYAEALPTIDIVRCKECRYNWDNMCIETYHLVNGMVAFDVMPDDFCSYGERKESE